MSDAPPMFESLVAILQLLAADYHAQLTQLPSFIYLPDELALAYYDSISLLDQIVEAGIISATQASALQSLDTVFAHMDKSLYSYEALETSREWQDIRRDAGLLLDLLGQPRSVVPLAGITYIPGQLRR